MPEIIEVEMYRRAADAVVGRTIASVEAPDNWFFKSGDEASARYELEGCRVEATDRHGKLLMLVTDGPVLGLRFGMTGRLVVDSRPVIESLEYSSKRLDPAWNRFALHFSDGGSLEMNDPRRLGGVTLDPDRSKLGPDAWSVTVGDIERHIERRTSAIKAFLLNQAKIAGLGNLLTDELLWRVGVHPGRPCDAVTNDDLALLVSAIRPMLDELDQRGGCHLGDHVEVRETGARCPRDGGLMMHDTIGGRSTWWCSAHQH